MLSLSQEVLVEAQIVKEIKELNEKIKTAKKSGLTPEVIVLESEKYKLFAAYGQIVFEKKYLPIGKTP